MHSGAAHKNVGHIPGVQRRTEPAAGHMQEWLTVGSERGASLREAK
jgi:hypothetical protein